MAWVFIALSLISFFIGYYAANVTPHSYKYKKIKNPKLLINLTLAIAIIGLGCKFYDKFFIRGFTIWLDSMEGRALIAEKGGNFVAIIASAISSFAFFPIFIKLYYKLKLSKFYNLIIFSVFFFQIFDLLLIGSRSAFLLIISFLLLYLLYFKVILINKKFWVWFIIGSFCFLTFISYVFIERLKEWGVRDVIIEHTLTKANLNFTIAPNAYIIDVITNNIDNPIGSVVFAYTNITQYYVHGIFEFNYVYDKFEKDHSLGAYTFFPYYRFIKKITNQPFQLEDIEQLSPRVGVYTSIFGPFFIDFGWFNLIFMIFSGWHIRKVYEKALIGIPHSVILYFFYFIVLVFWTTFNYVFGSIGIFILTDIFLLKLIYNLLGKTYILNNLTAK